MKCDEDKPSCLKCRSTGRTCDGYLTQENHQNNALQRCQVTSTGTMTIGRTPYVGIIGNDQERRGFKFFQFRTAQELATALDLTSWHHFMLQASHSNPAVLHAAIALGALGERFQINSVLTTDNAQANNRHDFACRQYCKAVTQLREQLCNDKEHSVDFVLMSCFLFVCFEFLQGNDEGALMHLRSGLEILCREQGRPTMNDLTALPPAGLPLPLSDPALMDGITYVFSIMDVQATIWLGLESFQSPAMTPVGLPDPTPLIPACFSSLKEAKKSLDEQITTIYHFQRLAAVYIVSHSPDQAPPTAIAERQERLTQLGEWLLAMETFAQQHSHEFSPDDLRCITVMNINHKVTLMTLTVSFQPDEEALYRSFHAKFAKIVSLAETLLRPDHSNGVPLNSPEPAPIFHFPAILIQPLYFTAVKCRLLPTCRKAISLLSASPWREGAWDSAAMAKIAERKVRQWEDEGVRYGYHDGSERSCTSSSSSSPSAGEGVITGVGASVWGGPAPSLLPPYGNSVHAERIFHHASRLGELRTAGVGL